MSGTWADHLARERERYRRVAAGEATAAEIEAQAIVDAYDLDYFSTFGRYPEESRFNYAPPAPDDSRRRAAIQSLIDRGATEGERDAARAAMARLDQADELARLEADRQDEDDYEDALAHGAA